MKTTRPFLCILFLLVILTSCTTTKTPKNELDNRNTLTLGAIQRTIKKGISQSDVVIAIGSPNIVTNDEKGVETWIYDKIYTESVSDEAKGTIAGAGIGGTAVGYGGISGKRSHVSTTQKTLTVLIKFNEEKRVEDIRYHSSRY